MQYEEEIVDLRNAMESLQSRLSRAEQLYLQGAMQAALAVKERELEEKRRDNESSRYTPSPTILDSAEEAKKSSSSGHIKSMIGRLVALEDELQREKRKMADKQKVIEAQVQTIQALDAANNRLLAALAQLRNYHPENAGEREEIEHSIMSSFARSSNNEPEFCVSSSSSSSLSMARRILADLGEVQSSSC